MTHTHTPLNEKQGVDAVTLATGQLFFNLFKLSRNIKLS